MMMQSPPKLNHEGLSMEERRARNMQRNQEFLENLMKTIQHEATGDQSTEINEAANPLSLKEPFEEVASRDSQALDALCRLSHKNEVLPLFNHRECQISSIYSYLERFSIMRNNVGHYPSLVLHGGSGKTSVVETILDMEAIPHIFIKCSQYSSMKHFLMFMQYELLSVLTKQNSRQTHSHSLFMNPCFTIQDFIHLLLHAQKLLISNLHQRFIIVLTNFDATNSFAEPDACTQILSLLDVESSFTFVITTTSISGSYRESEMRCVHRPFRIFFPPYSSKQMEEVVVNIFHRRVNSIANDFNHQTTCFKCSTKYCSCSSNTMEGITDADVDEQKKQIAKRFEEVFAHLCEHTLPMFTHIYSKVNTMVNIIEGIWKILFHGSINDVFERLLQSMEETSHETLFVKSKKMKSSSTPTPKRTIVPQFQVNFEMPKVSILKNIVEEILRLEVVKLSDNQIKYFQEKYDPESTSTTTNNNTNNPKIDILSINATAIPLRMRCLIIACYLATHNPKESDNLKFVGERSKKRKNGDHAAGSEQKDSSGPSHSSSSKASLTNKCFSLERLMSIYGQVLHISTVQPFDALYGDVNIHAMINSLIEKHLLCRVTPKLSRAMFSCNVSRSLAESISKSIRFQLNHFVTNHYNQII